MNTAAIDKPSLASQVAMQLRNQCIAVAIDAKRVSAPDAELTCPAGDLSLEEGSAREVYTHRGRNATDSLLSRGQ